MGATSRRKGAAWEREVAAMLRELPGVAADRSLTEVRDGNTGDLYVDGLPVVVQCKVGQRPNACAALGQAIEAADGSGHHPVAIVRQNRSGGREKLDYAVVPLADWLEMAGALKRLGWW